MAGKRKLSQTSTPSSLPQSEPKSEPESQPETETIPEPMIEDDVENDVENDKEEQKEEAGEEEEGSEEKEEDGDEENPQNVENPNSEKDFKDEEGIDSDPESLKELLNLFPNDQLISILSSVASSQPDFLKKIHEIAEVHPSACKIFVHGLPWRTTAETLTSLFSQYGEIEECKAVVDKATGKSKGYAFIRFKTRQSALKALKEPQKKIGNRALSCQLASLGPARPSSVAAASVAAPAASEYTQRKIFVSNVGTDVDVKKLVEFLGKYGEIEEGPLGLDKGTGKPRGFCLFVYKSVESARKALEEPHKTFEGTTLHCQRAVDGMKFLKTGFQQRGTDLNFGAGAVGGYTMTPSGSGYGYNKPPNPALNPATLTALLAGQGVGGLSNILGDSGMQGGYGGRGHGYGPGAGGPSYMGQR